MGMAERMMSNVRHSCFFTGVFEDLQNLPAALPLSVQEKRFLRTRTSTARELLLDRIERDGIETNRLIPPAFPSDTKSLCFEVYVRNVRFPNLGKPRSRSPQASKKSFRIRSDVVENFYDFMKG